jgi:hypothetical protein
VAITEQEKTSTRDGHLRRHDFSRWIAEVLAIYPLMNVMRSSIERDYRGGKLTGIIARLSDAARSRCEFTEPYPKRGGSNGGFRHNCRRQLPQRLQLDRAMRRRRSWTHVGSTLEKVARFHPDVICIEGEIRKAIREPTKSSRAPR